MLFFTDLDRTIIYSRRFICDGDETVLVERDGEKEIAFMTVRGVALIKKLAAKIPVIPVTTRNYAECMRIGLLKELGLRYLIINNGAEILCDGVRDADYQSGIQAALSALGCGFDEALRVFFDIFGNGGVKLHRISDDFLWLIVLYSEDYDRPLLKRVQERLAPEGWSVAATGRKIYLIPRTISKTSAVQYLTKKLGAGPIVCAGDSTMDMEMVEHADIGLVPNGSALCPLLPRAVKTVATGIRAGEEILETVLRIYENGGEKQ